MGRLSEVCLPVTERGIGHGEYNLELCSVRGWSGMVGSKEMNSGEMDMEDRFNGAPKGHRLLLEINHFHQGGINHLVRDIGC